MKTTHVLIPDADAELSLKVLRCLGAAGCYATTLMTTLDDNPVRYSRFCSGLIKGPAPTASDWPSALEQWGVAHPGAVLLPVTLAGFQQVASQRNRLEKWFHVAPLPSRERIDLASDKWRLFEAARPRGLPLLPSCPASAENLAALAGGRGEFGLPVLVKSRHRRGGFGFQKLETPAAVTAFAAAVGPGGELEYLVQPFIDGVDYSLSVCCRSGQIMAYTLWRALRYGGRRYSIPRIVEFVEHADILAAGRTLMALLEWEGVCDIDFFLDPRTGRFWLLEVNARFWQTVIACLPAGINFPDLCCRIATGAPPAEWPRQHTGLRYSRPSGVPALLAPSPIHLRGWRDLTRQTGVGDLLRDPGPEWHALWRTIRPSHHPQGEPA